LRRRPLSQALKARADVIVELKDLGFADASLMLDLAMLARRLRKADRSLHLCGAQPHIHVLIEYVGLHRLEGVIVESQPAPA
jgi:anti-anti-sigma regulatory factor